MVGLDDISIELNFGVEFAKCRLLVSSSAKENLKPLVSYPSIIINFIYK